jgi:hypothetical protein
MTVVLKNTLLKNTEIRSWRPTDIENTILWLDAADSTTITLNGSDVSQWSDKSGNSNHATQSTASKQPEYRTNIYNGKATITGDSATFEQLNISNLLTSIDELFIVCRFNSTTEGIMGTTTDWGNIVYREANTNYYPSTPGSAGFSFANSSTSLQLFNYGQAGARVNGVQVKVNKMGVWSTVSDLYILARGGDGGRNWSSGDVCEIILYDRTLSLNERLIVEAYLTNKWGI